jgi:hypothetical protein
MFWNRRALHARTELVPKKWILLHVNASAHMRQFLAETICSQLGSLQFWFPRLRICDERELILPNYKRSRELTAE